MTAGIAGGVIGDSTGSAIASSETGKRAVENNFNLGTLMTDSEYTNGLASQVKVNEIMAPAEQKAREEVREIAVTLAELGADMTPILGDVKGFYDAESGIDYILATVGIIPGADIITKPLKDAKELYQAAKKAKAAGAIEEARKYQALANNYTSSSLDYIYSSKEVRNVLEHKYGKADVISTTVPPGNAKNVKLAGQRHPKTNVAFDNKGFPIFDDIAQYDTRLNITDFKNASYAEQMKMATRDLADSIERGIVDKNKFMPEQLKAIYRGDSKIPGLTWHHHQDTGRMQLIDTDLHKRTGHIGGEGIKNGK